MDNTKDILTQERIDSERRSLKLGGAQYDGIFKSHAALLDRVRELEQGWIPVSEKPPAPGEYLVFFEHENERWMSQAECDADGFPYFVTHYKPLPAPPIAGKERTV